MMNWAENSISKFNHAKASLGNRDKPNMIWMKEKQDDRKLRIYDHKFSDGIPTLSAALTDWEEGIACLAGKPNSGKSTILVNMMLQGCELNDDVLIIDITLDDSYKKRFEQYIASMTGLYYQEITTKVELSETKILLRAEAEKKILKWYEEDKLRTIEVIEKYDTEVGTTTLHFRDPEEILRLMRKVRHENPHKKIAIFIDAWNNIDVSGAKANSDLNQANYILGKFQEECTKQGIMLMLSAHLRKTDGKRSRPSLEDIKGTSDMSYNVVWAGIVRNELKENALKNPLTITEGNRIYPIVAIDIVKSKVSTWETTLLYQLKSGQCTVDSLHEYQYKEYLEKYLGPRK